MRLRFILLLSLALIFKYNAKATHLVGGEFTYKYMGTAAGGNKYQVSLSIYEDCINGSLSAIASDNPACFALYDGNGMLINVDSNVYYFDSVVVPANFNNICVINPPAVCLEKKTFVKNYILPPNSSGYSISYQRCCRNGAIVNILDPGNSGTTYYCTIPPTSLAAHNTSAVFKNYPPQIICVNTPLYYDHSATDVDGDSLSYSFTYALDGGSSNHGAPKPIPSAPPYDSVIYLMPYSSVHPITSFPGIQIDPVTGFITGTPNRVGRYLVAVCCVEWRNHKIIDTIRREFQFVVTPCSKTVVACIPQLITDPETYVINCYDNNVHFTNCSSGGTIWHWEFGIPGQINDTSNEFEPTFSYPDTGTYLVKLIANPNSNCPDSTWKYVKMYAYLHTMFDAEGKFCTGDSIQFIDKTISVVQPISGWLWSFGDGNTSSAQNTVHTYSNGGTFNAMLVSQNNKGCIDTFIKQITIEKFMPFAGNDTIIIKGENIQFNAEGGYDYFWSPSEYLNNCYISNPNGYFPDTGNFSYIVYVQSQFGCKGSDTINVQVVNQAAFFVPTAFSPNGDGKNDIFRPTAIGYKQLNYLKVFNRWGQLVYFTESFDNSWDGSFKNKPAESGVYYWEICYTDKYNNKGFMKGDVTLIR